MRKKLKKVLIITVAMLLMGANIETFATAVPQKVDKSETSEISERSETSETSETQAGSSETLEKYEKSKDMVVEAASKQEESKTTETKNEESAASTDKTTETKPEGTASPTTKPTEKASPKPTEKETPKETEKETTKTTEKTSEKAKKEGEQEKETKKSTVKPTQKGTEKKQQLTVSTIAPEEIENTEIAEETIADSTMVDDEDENHKPELNVVSNQEQINANKYLTKGGAFLVFILTVLVSAVVSFLISYRFYKMSRTDGHLAAEIRALKRDIDIKMTGTVGGFSEYETKTTNKNVSYAKESAPIGKSSEGDEDSAAGAGIYAKWERQINTKYDSEVEEAAERRPERRSSSAKTARSSKGKKSKSTADKIKNAFDDFFTKKK